MGGSDSFRLQGALMQEARSLMQRQNLFRLANQTTTNFIYFSVTDPTTGAVLPALRCSVIQVSPSKSADWFAGPRVMSRLFA